MRLTKILVILLIVVCVADAQRRRNRNKNRNKGGPSCHLKDAEKCLDSLSALGKNKNPTAIIATSAGLDKLCSTIKKDFMGCLRNFFKKCGTPLHREVLGLILDQAQSHTNKFCDNGPEREKFLKSSPCLHEKVLSQKPMKENCNNRYLATLNKVSSNNLKEGEDSTLGVCCGYRFWEDCSKNLIKSECGDSGIEAFDHLISKGFVGLPDLTCPRDLFVFTSKECQGILAPKGKKVNLKEVGVGKYNVANMFSWLFAA